MLPASPVQLPGPHGDGAPHPRGLLAGGVALAGLAGYVNAVALLADITHVPVSHMSGAIAHLGTDAVGGAGDRVLVAAAVLGSFLAGSVVSGVVVGGERLLPGRRYGVALLIEALALAFAALALMRGLRSATYCSAFACGLQNAMATSYAGLVIRTTHMTGVVTDLGLLIGHWLRHRRQDHWRLAMLGGLLGAFLLGGVAGAFGARWLGGAALWPATAACAAAGAGYLTWRWRNRTRLGSIW